MSSSAVPTARGSSPRHGRSGSSPKGRETLAGWGNLGVPGREVRSEDLAALTRDAVLTRGLGRSYGDAALPPAGIERVACSTLADRLLAFDVEAGVVRAEAGLSLAALHRVVLPYGWFAPVAPGTQQVTLGGMVAADVHGKNHHLAGSFGSHVRALRLRLADGRVVDCGPEEESELFWATVGGMGLTGHVLEVELPLERVPSPWILCETRRFRRLAPLVEALREASQQWPFTAAWLDCLVSGDARGRGVLLSGRWAAPEEAPAAPPKPRPALTVPFAAPGWLLNRLTVGLFNRLYFAAQRPGRRVVSPEAFFFPLDVVHRWSRLYGRRGMTQHQCVLPGAGAAEVLRFLEAVAVAGGAPFLAVLKDFGDEGRGVLSFPRPGLTLALDFAVGEGTPKMVATLNHLVAAAGGRIYLAKDAFTTPAELAAMEGERLTAFRAARRRWDPDRRLRSRLWERLDGDGLGAGAGTADAAAPGAGASGGEGAVEAVADAAPPFAAAEARR
jgi:decaprenylphospho-beta-D-ribofuranose 2-oxidase